MDAFLGKYKSSSPADQAAQSTSTSTPTTLSLPVLDADRFQLSVGKLLLCLQKQDRGGFDTELEKARTQVLNAIFFWFIHFEVRNN